VAKGFPVVMIHGAFCGAWSFAPWRPVFEARGFAVHTPTLRHHASREEAARRLAGVSLRDYAADISALINALDSPPVVIGHSLGGLLAQMLAATLGVRALVLLAPLAPLGIFPSTPFECVTMQALLLEGAFWKKILPPHQAIAAAHAFDCVPEPDRAAFLERLVPESGLALFESMYWMSTAAPSLVLFFVSRAGATISFRPPRFAVLRGAIMDAPATNSCRITDTGLSANRDGSESLPVRLPGSIRCSSAIRAACPARSRLSGSHRNKA
jgi:pimeloyl-ACP methyl ester carboxylesterase